MRGDRIVVVLCAGVLTACAHQPRPTTPRPVVAASILGDQDLVGVSVEPRVSEWYDDVTVRTLPGAHVAVLEFSRRGKPQLRLGRGETVQSASSIFWRTRGEASGAELPRFGGGTAGQTVCQSVGFAPSGVTGTGQVTPITCTDDPAQPSHAPSSVTQRAEYRAVLVVVSDSTLRIDRAAVLRQFAAARGNVVLLSDVARRMVRQGRWAAVVHRPGPS